MSHHDHTEVIAGAEPFSAAGGSNGALVLHGFTGNPQSMRGLAEALAAAGFTVELPRLPGHGTTLDDMLTTSWDDWSAAAEVAYTDLASRCERVVVTGLSMGGTLSVWLATRHPEIAGIAVVNALVEPLDASIVDLARDLIDKGEATMPGVGNDIADPDQTELAYELTPLACLLSLSEAVAAMSVELPRIELPVMVLSAPQDHVVPPANSDTLATAVRGPVERVTLDRSFHVATLDYDRALIEQRVVDFATRVTAG
jgi:carboxylesterase